MLENQVGGHYSTPHPLVKLFSPAHLGTLYGMSGTQNVATIVRNYGKASDMRRGLSTSWTKAAGMLIARKLKLEKHVRNVRKEWSHARNS